jgi:hypothetical protein
MVSSHGKLAVPNSKEYNNIDPTHTRGVLSRRMALKVVRYFLGGG